MGLLDRIKGLLGGGGWAGQVDRYGGASPRLPQQNVVGLAFTSDGRELIALSDDGVLAVTVASGKPPRPGELDNALVVWDLKRGAVARRLPGRFSALAASRDGRVLACVLQADQEGRARGVQVMDPQDGRLLLSLPDVSAAAVSGDGTTLLTRAGDSVRVHLLSAPQAPRWELSLPCSDAIARTALALSADGSRAAVAEEAGIAVLDERGARVHELGIGRARRLLFLPDGRLVVGGHTSLFLWGPSAGAAPVALLTYAAQDWLLCLGCAPDGTRFASGHRAGQVRVFSSSGQEEPVLETIGPAVGALAFAPPASARDVGELLLTGTCFPTRPSDPGAIQQFELATGRERGASGHAKGIRWLGLSGDGTRLLSAGDDLRLIAWEVGAPSSGRVVGQMRYTYSQYGVTSDFTACVHPPGEGKGLVVLPLDGGPERRVGEAATEGFVDSGFALSSDGQRVLICMRGKLSLLDLRSGDELTSLKIGASDDPRATLLDGGRVIAWTQLSSGGGPTQDLLHLVRVEDGQPLRAPAAFPHKIAQLLGDAEGKRLLVGLHGGTPPELLDVATGQRSRWKEPAACWALSSDGTRVAATGEEACDLTLRDARTGQVVTRLPRRHEARVRAAVFTPGGDLISGAEDGVILHWRLAGGSAQ